MEDLIKPVGPSKASKPDAGGGNIRGVPVFGIVKDNIDPTRSGRIQVYISDLGSNDPDNASSWVTVSYMSPFFGSVEPKAGDTGYGDYVSNPSSYGFWNSPPDIGSTVICLFINGDPTYGFYIGCVPKPEALHMVPAIGASDNVILNNDGEAQGYGGATRLPVTNINTNNAALADGPNFLNEPKPVHSYTAMTMNQQGLIRDPIRGPISSSAQRESPSRVGWGVSTPGRPIYEGGFTDETILDAASNPGQQASLKVIARRGGHSIVMDDGDIIGQDQLVRIRSAAGHQILMSDDGQTLFVIHANGQSYIELGKEGTIDMYASNSVNIRTQGDLNLHADRDVNINAKRKLNMHADSVGLYSDNDFVEKVGGAYVAQTQGNFTHKVNGAMSLLSGGGGSIGSSNSLSLNGSKINLNSGGPSVIPQIVPAIPLIAHTDTLYDSVKGYAAAPAKLLSIVSRAPAHAPWANAGQGVDVKTTSNASSALPAPASPAVTAANATASASPPTSPVTAAVASTAPQASPVSKSIDANTTGALVAAAATNAATGPTASAVATGAGVIPGDKLVASIGSFGQTPSQLEAANILKPGSAALVDALVQGGASLRSAMPPSLFTGVPGAQNLPAFLSSTTAQVNAQVRTFQQAQTALTNSSVITGNESPGAIAGMVMSAATVGTNQTISAVRASAASLSPPAAGTTGTSDAVSNAISSGNFAAKVSQISSGGLGGLSSSLSSITNGVSSAFNGAIGAASSAFNAITKSFKSLQVGVPQNLASIAKADIPTPSDVSGILAAASKVGGTAASTIASGVDALPGGQNAIGSITSTAQIPGISSISTLIANKTTEATNGITLPSSLPTPGALVLEGMSEIDTTKIKSTIAALTSNGPSPIKMPTIGIDTDDRTEITSQISSLLGDFKIPRPTTGGPTTASKAELQKSIDKAQKQTNLTVEVIKIQDKIAVAQQKYDNLESTLPQGSPEIAAAKQELDALQKEKAEKEKLIDKTPFASRDLSSGA